MMNNSYKYISFLFLLIVFDTVFSYVSLFPENITALQATGNISDECANNTKNRIENFILCIRPVHPAVRIIDFKYHWAICIPSKCTTSEISAIPTYSEDYCYSKDTAPELTTGAIITIVVLSIFLSISICSTIFDIYLYYMEKQAPHGLLIAFSMLTNGRKLFNTTTNPDQLLCLNGIKSISMMWVILGHIYSLIITAPLLNLLDVLEFLGDEWNMFMIDSTLSVDTFLTVGGLVTVYTFLKSMDKGAKFNIILYYIHRYLRLTPAFGICILVYANLLKYFDVAPLWGDIETSLSEDCIKYWWGSFFYIFNYAHTQCMPHSWYLSIDMQLFLLSPLVLIPLHRFEKIGVYLLGFLSFLGIIIPFAVGYGYRINANMVAFDPDFTFYYYKQTHARFGPYVIGMLFGYLIFKNKKGQLNIALKPILACGLWLATMAGLIACVYAPYDAFETYNRVSHSLILAFQRQAWSLGVCIVIYLCVFGYGGPIDRFLSLPIFQILTKLSYSMYLVHYAIVSMQFDRPKTLIHFSNYDMMFMFWGDFMLTLVLSIALCLMFESPVIIIEKYLFGRGKSTTKDKPAA